MTSSSRVTPAQTIGPFFHGGMAWAMTRPAEAPRKDEALVTGVVVDADGLAVTDALVEIWQPGLCRSVVSPAEGFQRLATDEAGRFCFVVRRAVEGPSLAHVTLFARGLLRELRTRVYVDTEVDELRRLPELAGVPPDRLATLLASGDRNGRSLEWTVRLQGPGETLFFEFTD